MINPVTFSGIPIFGSGSVKVAPPSPAPAINGYLPADILPAQHVNYFFGNITSDLGLTAAAMAHIIAELDNYVTASGQTITPADDTQMARALNAGGTFLNAGSPYTLVSLSTPALIINAATNPYVVNLPVATGSGYRVSIVNVNVAITGLVKITPNGTDKIGPAGNVSVYLQNTDQGGALNYFQRVDLLDALSGYWVVTGGQYCPAQSVDTNGQQYFLGRLHHMPLGNTTDRSISGMTAVPGNATYGGPYQVTGLYGVPAGAKGVRLRGRLTVQTTAIANTDCRLGISFTDNNSFTPSDATGHPGMYVRFFSTGAGSNSGYSAEVDVPLNSAGQFYTYQHTTINVDSSTFLNGIVVGFYMGD
jgi:hypothetical protein